VIIDTDIAYMDIGES